MTVALQSACHHHAIGAVLECVAAPSSTSSLPVQGSLTMRIAVRVRQAHRARQVGRGVGAIVARKRHDVWAKVFGHDLCYRMRERDGQRMHYHASIDSTGIKSGCLACAEQRFHLRHHLRVGIVAPGGWPWPDIRTRTMPQPWHVAGSMYAAPMMSPTPDRFILILGTSIGADANARQAADAFLRRSPRATMPPAVSVSCERIVAARAAAACAWAIALVQELGVVARPGHENAIGGKIHRAQLDVRFQEPAIQVHRHFEASCPVPVRLRRAPVGSLSTTRSGVSVISRPNIGSQTLIEIGVLGIGDLWPVVVVVADEQDALLAAPRCTAAP